MTEPVDNARLRPLKARLGAAALAVLGTVAAILLALVVIKIGSEWLASSAGIADAAQRAEEIGRARTTVLAVLAGALAAVGAVYTHRSFGLNRESLELNRQVQITERFTRAVDQLGNRESVDVRLGGIYALERIARDSKYDHPQVVEVLTAYVREHAPRSAAGAAAATESHPDAPAAGPTPMSKGRPDTDVQAALTVLGRRTLEHEKDIALALNLAGTHLAHAHLNELHLSGANLS